MVIRHCDIVIEMYDLLWLLLLVITYKYSLSYASFIVCCCLCCDLFARHLEYKDSHAAVRVLTPASQEGGVHSAKRPSTTYHQQRRSSFSTTGLFGHVSPDKVKLHSQDDMNKFDPILMNKRYPQESERQIGRWTTESRSSFGRSKKGSPGHML